MKLVKLVKMNIKEKNNSPMCLQTKPPAVRSGYVHLVSLHIDHLYASVPAEQRENSMREQNESIAAQLFPVTNVFT